MFFRCVVISAAAVLLSALAVANASAQPVIFTTTTYPNNNLWSQSGRTNGHIRADLNGDGREDFISQLDGSFNGGCTGSFAVTLSTGDGAYSAPVCYTIPNATALNFAVGDFNADGTLDVVVTTDTDIAYVYFNGWNGAASGSLTLAYIIGLGGQPGGIVAADVNHDGHIDLVYTLPNSQSGTQTVSTLFGDGKGGFSAGFDTSFNTGGEPAGALTVGDFDGDGKADVLVVGVSQVVNQILYGDGGGSFTATPSFGPHTQYGLADPSSDGAMSLIGAVPTATGGYSNVLDLEHGHYDRVFTSQHITLKSCLSGGLPVLADFDGDGINDLIVAEDSDCKGDPPYTLNFMKNTGNSTFAAEQVIYSTNDWISEYDVLRASHSSKPDLTVWQSLLVNRNQISNPQQLVLVNTTSGNFPSCTPLNFRATGIAVCGPTSSVGATSPVNFSFAGSNESPGRDMEIWVDGRKLDESLTRNYSYYDFVQGSIPLSAGQHQVDIYSVGWDYSLLEYSIPLLVGSSICPIPEGGVNVCSPLYDSVLPAGFPVLVYATGAVPSGTAIVRMEVWVDGVKKYSTYGSHTLKTNLILAPGRHQLTYYIVDNSGGLQATIGTVSVQ